PEYRESELDRLRRGDRHDAVFVREGRMIHRVVFDVELGNTECVSQAARTHQRREPGIEASARLADRQQLDIAPQRTGSRLNELPADDLTHRVVVVCDFERTEALAAYPVGLGRVGCTTEVTGQPGHELHTVLLTAPDSRTREPWSSTSSVRTVASTPARSYIDDNRVATFVSPARASSATDGPAPERNAPSASGSSSASASERSGTSDSRAD